MTPDPVFRVLHEEGRVYADGSGDTSARGSPVLVTDGGALAGLRARLSPEARLLLTELLLASAWSEDGRLLVRHSPEELVELVTGGQRRRGWNRKAVRGLLEELHTFGIVEELAQPRREDGSYGPLEITLEPNICHGGRPRSAAAAGGPTGGGPTGGGPAAGGSAARGKLANGQTGQPEAPDAAFSQVSTGGHFPTSGDPPTGPHEHDLMGETPHDRPPDRKAHDAASPDPAPPAGLHSDAGLVAALERMGFDYADRFVAEQDRDLVAAWVAYLGRYPRRAENPPGYIRHMVAKGQWPRGVREEASPPPRRPEPVPEPGPVDADADAAPVRGGVVRAEEVQARLAALPEAERASVEAAADAAVARLSLPPGELGARLASRNRLLAIHGELHRRGLVDPPGPDPP